MTAKQVELVPSKVYETVIQVNIPIRFYFSKNQTFDGIELGEFKTDPDTSELIALNRLLDFMEDILNAEQ